MFQAKRKPFSFVNEFWNSHPIQSPRPLFEPFNTVVNEDDACQEDSHKLVQSCQHIEQFLELKNPSNDIGVESAILMNGLSDDVHRTLHKDNNHVYDSLDQYYVPPSLIERWGSAMGILALLIGYSIFKSQCYNLTTVYCEKKKVLTAFFHESHISLKRA